MHSTCQVTLERYINEDITDGKRCFVELDDLGPEQLLVTHTGNSTDLVSLLDEYAYKQFPSPSSSPCWRVALLNHHAGFDVLLNFHHTVADGTGAKHVATTFAESLSDLQPPNSSPRGMQELPPPLEYLVDLRPSIWYMFKEVLLDRVPSLRPPVTAWLGPAHNPVKFALETLTTCSQLLSLPDELVTKLYNTTKKHGTTLHGALTAAAVLATAAASDSNDLLITHAVNLRPKDMPQWVLRSYVCGVSTKAALCPTTNFWDLAVNQKRQLVAGIGQGKQTIGLLGFLSGSWQEFFGRFLARKPNGRRHSVGELLWPS